MNVGTGKEVASLKTITRPRRNFCGRMIAIAEALWSRLSYEEYSVQRKRSLCHRRKREAHTIDKTGASILRRSSRALLRGDKDRSEYSGFASLDSCFELPLFLPLRHS